MTDKALKDFTEITEIGSSQYVLGINDASTGQGAKITLSNLLKSSISEQDNNLLTQGSDNKIYAQDKVGDLDDLQTSAKDNVVNAINEVGSGAAQIGDLSTLTTTNKETLVKAINEIDTDIATEITERETADNNLQSQVDALSSKAKVTDVVATHAALLEYDTSKLIDDDIIKVLSDETLEGAATYYRWIIEGGVGSWTYIGTEGNYYTKAQSDGRFVPQTRTINNKALSSDISFSLSDISDVSVSDIQTGDSLVYDGSVWKNQSLGASVWGNISGTLSNQTDLQEVLDKKADKFKVVFNWIKTSIPSSIYWTDICYGDGKFVIIANGSNVAAYSEDGINWTQTTMPASAYWISVCYGNGKFVAVAYGTSTAAYSEDGINWTQTTMPTSASWTSVCYGNGKFVAVMHSESYNYAGYSNDGISWTLVSISSGQNWTSVCYGNGKFVAVSAQKNSGDYSDVAAYSEDGSNWTEVKLPTTSAWQSVCYGDGKFVAITYASSNVAAYSEDGINWTQTTMPASAYWISVCYGNGKFVAITSKSASNIAAYSEDGINWTQTTMPTTEHWQSVCYGDGKFVAITYDSFIAAYASSTVEYLPIIISSSSSHILLGSGTLIQWGKATRSSSTQTVTLGYAYADTDYAIMLQPYHSTASTDGYPILVYESSNKTSTTFVANEYTSWTGFYWMTIGKGVIS